MVWAWPLEHFFKRVWSAFRGLPATFTVGDERVSSWVWNGARVVGPVEGYGGFRLSEEGRCGQFGRIDLAERDLLAAFGVIGR